MIDENYLKYLCDPYNISCRVFPETGVAILDTGLDEWQVKVDINKSKPFCLLHKNKIRQTSKYHIQRRLRTLNQAVDCILRHKGVLKSLYGSNTYRNNHTRGNTNCLTT